MSDFDAQFEREYECKGLFRRFNSDPRYRKQVSRLNVIDRFIGLYKYKMAFSQLVCPTARQLIEYREKSELAICEALDFLNDEDREIVVDFFGFDAYGRGQHDSSGR